VTRAGTLSAMAVTMTGLCDELLAETADLESLLTPLDESGWDTPTPAIGWAVRDQVAHLAFFDGAARLAATDPQRFRGQRDEAMGDVDMVERAVAADRGRPGAELLTWLLDARRDLVDTACTMDPTTRVPWYGPDMSMASSITARIMETWAHGQDVADALGTFRVPTDRLRHIAFLGVRALPNSYVVQGRPVPDAAVRVELRGPSGALWTFGADQVGNTVRGTALDFCLAVTQRRNLADLDLELGGPVAGEWMAIAQAFAGPAGPGRQAGQFPPAAAG
jgi:uncharacterized protein (TIGR03084 family)